MPFPYSFPFDFDVIKRILRLLVGHRYDLLISKEKKHDLSVRGFHVHDLYVDSGTERGLGVRGKTRADMHIEPDLAGGG